jgi:hypothetical protein
LYSEALLKSLTSKQTCGEQNLTNLNTINTQSNDKQFEKINEESNEFPYLEEKNIKDSDMVYSSSLNTANKFGYLSDEDNESFVSADSVWFFYFILIYY